MKSILLALTLLILNSSFSQLEEIYLGPFMSFQKGYITYTFQDESELRDKPGPEGKTLLNLKVAEKVEIDSTIETNYERAYQFSDYFKVKCKGVTGYMQVKDLAIANLMLTKYKTNLLFQLPDLDDAAAPLLHVKETYEGKVVNDVYLEMNSVLFQLKLSEPRGLTGIEKLFYIDYISEACGMEGGQSIYSWNPGSLSLIADLTEVADAGVFYFTEKFIFPADKGGESGKILYKAEEMELFDEESEWQSVKNVSRIYTWKENQLFPEFTRDPYEIPEIGVNNEMPDDNLEPVEEGAPNGAVDENFIVDDDAQFPGGLDSLISFIQSNLIYPEEAEKNGISGKVFVQFVVEIDGSISNIKVLRSPDVLLSDESVRIIESMPKWIPGKKSHKPVRSVMTLPINFVIEDSEK